MKDLLEATVELFLQNFLCPYSIYYRSHVKNTSLSCKIVHRKPLIIEIVSCNQLYIKLIIELATTLTKSSHNFSRFSLTKDHCFEMAIYQKWAQDIPNYEILQLSNIR